MHSANKWSPLSIVDRFVVTETTARRNAYLSLRQWLLRKDLAHRSLSEVGAGADEKLIEIPRDKGYLVKDPGNFPEVERIVHKTRAIVEQLGLEKIKHWARSEKQNLWTSILPEEEKQVSSPFFQFVLRKDIVHALTAYLGKIPVLRYADIWYSPPKEPAKTLQNSQFYHCDWDADSQIKLFVLIDEVKPESGPLTLLDAEFSEQCRKALNYRWGPRWEENKGRVTDDKLAALGEKGRAFALTGPSGSVGFVDTSRCFHYGSRVEKKAAARTVAIFQFVRPGAFVMPLNFRKSTPFRHLATPDMPKWQRLLLGAE